MSLRTIVNDRLVDGAKLDNLPSDTLSEIETLELTLTSHTENNSNPHSVTKAQLGLSEVDNTSDINKPISTATQTALNAKANQSTTYTKLETAGLLANKVDVVAGKGLSQEDYTTTEKSKLAGIETGAEVNNISDINATDLTDGGDTTLHTHDSRYYTESETDTLLNAKANDSEVVKLTGDQSISGNKNFAGNTLYVDDTNDRVGVGTSTPNSKLHTSVNGGTNILTIESVTGGSLTSLLLESNGVVNKIISQKGPTDVTQRDLGFFTGVNERMRIATSGNVGIGTTTPTAKLHVISSASASFLTEWTSSDNQRLAGLYEESDTRATFSLFNSGLVQTVRFDTNGNSYLNGGNIGIGETSPDYKLDVNGAIGFTPGIGTTVTPVDNGDIVFQATSNTSLVIKMKGSDGVIRSTTLTLS